MMNMCRLLGYLISLSVIALFGGCAETAGGEAAPVQIELQSSISSGHIRLGDAMRVNAWLAKAGKVLVSRNMMRSLRISVHVRQPDGSSFSKALFDNGLDNDVKAGDGIYSCQFTGDQVGDHHILVVAEGKGFRKEHERVFSVLISGRADNPPLQGFQTKKGPTGEAHAEKPVARTFPPVTFGIIHGIIALLWLAAFGYLYLRARKAGPAGAGQKSANFGKIIQAQAEEKMKQLALDEKKEKEGGTSDARMITEAYGARLQFLKGVIKGGIKSKGDMHVVWGQIYDSFDETVESVLKCKKTAPDTTAVLQERVEEIGVQNEELRGAQALVDIQSRKIAFLLSFKDVLDGSQQKFDSLKQKNKELEQMLFDAAHKAGVDDAMKAPLVEYRENYKKLELCVATLEHENERLVGEISRWQKELDQLRKHGQVTISETPAEVLKENEDLKEMVRDLEASVRSKEKELADAYQQFESLEAEYMVLYQEKQAKQPEI